MNQRWDDFFSIFKIKMVLSMPARSVLTTIKTREHSERDTLGEWPSSNKHRAERHRRMPRHLSLQLELSTGDGFSTSCWWETRLGSTSLILIMLIHDRCTHFDSFHCLPACAGVIMRGDLRLVFFSLLKRLSWANQATRSNHCIGRYLLATKLLLLSVLSELVD